jgi:hypothetical protein
MESVVIAAQVLVGASVAYVWVFRFHNIVKEFEQYGLSELVRSAVGASKISLATLLIAGIWFPALALVPALGMAFFMLCAQYFHFRAKNPWSKRLPSFVLLILSLLIASFHAGMIG